MTFTADYNPSNPTHRRALATQVISRVSDLGFVEVERTSGRYAPKELVFSRRVTLPTLEEQLGAPCSGQMTVRVYSTIGFDGSVRTVGADSIKVAAVYVDRNGRTRGIGKDKRVHRTGTIERILERLSGRIENVLNLATQPERCPDCGAPRFKSKKGNMVCAEFCWKNPIIQTRKQAKRNAIAQAKAKTTGINTTPWIGEPPPGIPW